MNEYLNIDNCINSNPDESFSNESIPASFGYDDISFKKKLKTFKKEFIFNLENRKPIYRATDQTEDVKIIVEF